MTVYNNATPNNSAEILPFISKQAVYIIPVNA